MDESGSFGLAGELGEAVSARRVAEPGGFLEGVPRAFVAAAAAAAAAAVAAAVAI